MSFIIAKILPIILIFVLEANFLHSSSNSSTIQTLKALSQITKQLQKEYETLPCSDSQCRKKYEARICLTIEQYKSEGKNPTLIKVKKDTYIVLENSQDHLVEGAAKKIFKGKVFKKEEMPYDIAYVKVSFKNVYNELNPDGPEEFKRETELNNTFLKDFPFEDVKITREDATYYQRFFEGGTVQNFYDKFLSKENKDPNSDQFKETFNRLRISLEKQVKNFHDRGFYHRDIKPENTLFYQDENRKWQVKIVDFGEMINISNEDIITQNRTNEKNKEGVNIHGSGAIHDNIIDLKLQTKSDQSNKINPPALRVIDRHGLGRVLHNLYLGEKFIFEKKITKEEIKEKIQSLTRTLEKRLAVFNSSDSTIKESLERKDSLKKMIKNKQNEIAKLKEDLNKEAPPLPPSQALQEEYQKKGTDPIKRRIGEYLFHTQEMVENPSLRRAQ